MSLLRDRIPDLRARRLIGADGSEIIFVFNYTQRPVSAVILSRAMKKIAELSDLGVKFKRAGRAWEAQVPSEEVLIVKLSR